MTEHYSADPETGCGLAILLVGVGSLGLIVGLVALHLLGWL